MSETTYCQCLPGQCSASEDGRAIGRVSVISDVRCKQALLKAHEPTATAVELLKAAAGHIGSRATTYDQPGGERSMDRTVDAFRAVTGHVLRESEGWLFMELLKAVRDQTKPGGHPDSQEDKIAYAALGAEARRAGR